MSSGGMEQQVRPHWK